MQIENSEDAKSMVRKYLLGTRSRHEKISSIAIDPEEVGPNEKLAWTIKGSYVTDEGKKEAFSAMVTARGEVTMMEIPKTTKRSSILR